MPGIAHGKIQIAGRAAADPGFTAAREPELLAFAHTRGNPHLVILRAGAAVGVGNAQSNRPDRTACRLFERHHDVGFNVLSAGRKVLLVMDEVATKIAAAKSAPAATE